MLKAPNWLPGQLSANPMLPTSVRQAISLALLATIPACATTQQQQIDKNTPDALVTIEQTPIPKTRKPATEKEALPEDMSFTPMNAIRAALSKPMKFVAQIESMCLWKNDKVFVRTSYCEPHTIGTPGERQTWFAIHSQKGETFEYYIEAPPGKSAYETKRSEYDVFGIRYRDLSAFKTTEKPLSEMTAEEYVSFIKIVYSPYIREIIPFCVATRGKTTCKSITIPQDLKHNMAKFEQKPEEDWYTLLGELKKLHNMHKLW